MRCQFVAKGSTKPERLQADVEVLFDAGTPFEGLKLVGFSIWKATPEGGLYVTLPGKPKNGAAKKYFEFLRAVKGDAASLNAMKAWIIKEYEVWKGAQG